LTWTVSRWVRRRAFWVDVSGRRALSRMELVGYGMGMWWAGAFDGVWSVVFRRQRFLCQVLTQWHTRSLLLARQSEIVLKIAFLSVLLFFCAAEIENSVALCATLVLVVVPVAVRNAHMAWKFNWSKMLLHNSQKLVREAKNEKGKRTKKARNRQEN